MVTQIDPDGAVRLIEAILLQAKNDYIKALKRKKNIKYEYYQYEKTINDCESFFRSELFYLFTNYKIKSEEVISYLRTLANRA